MIMWVTDGLYSVKLCVMGRRAEYFQINNFRFKRTYQMEVKLLIQLEELEHYKYQLCTLT